MPTAYDDILYIDMDDTLLKYSEAHARIRKAAPGIEYPQSLPGFFLNLELMEHAKVAYEVLKTKYRVMFLTAPSVYNPMSYAEKRQSIEKHFGFNACYNLILAQDKSLLHGAVLIDDRVDSNGQDRFQGRFIHFGSKEFPDWPSIVFELTGIMAYEAQVTPLPRAVTSIP